MSVSISGYVVEPVRVGQSNGTFTQTPDNYISNQAVFSAAYPADESSPRTDYLVLVTSEGLLENARFGWTKNEIVERFGYDALAGAFKLLRGSSPIEVGMLTGESNTKRLRVRPPVQADALAAAPFRISVGNTGSGLNWAIITVPTDDDFGSPVVGSVELSTETGNLNWNASDLIAHDGQRVRFQQQQFFLPKESSGKLGAAPTLTELALMLNPLPASGQIPRLRFGYGSYLLVEEVATEGAFTVPPAGTVQWASDTGRLHFNPEDAAANAGSPVYYDGVLFADSLALPSQSLGLISAPSTIMGVPPVGVDLIFRVDGASGYFRFPTVVHRPFASFDATGKKGEVQVDPSTGKVRFSTADQTKYAGKTVTLCVGDLPIERGISMRFLRNPVNLDGALQINDVTETYRIEGATWADPIIASSQVTLPSLPIDDAGHRMIVRLVQGQGTYVSDAFPDLNVPVPPAGLGYYVDFDSGTFFFAQRKQQLLITLQGTTSDVVLPDPLLLSSNLQLDKETGPGTDDYVPLVIGNDVLVDTTSGVVSFTQTNTLEAPEILADRYFDEVVLLDPSTRVERIRSLGNASNDPPLSVPVAYAGKSGFRLGASQDAPFATVVVVPDFTEPSGGTVQLSEATGTLKFATADLGTPIFWARTLTPKIDYQLQPELGLVQFSERLLAGEEARITYTVAPPSTTPPTPAGAPITEYARFLIRKELTQAHPSPTSTLGFNVAGLPVALSPEPAVFRGGRPQKLGVQCTVDVAASEITFLPDGQLTDALPHGATVGPNERVYIDYYVTQAVGGEKTFTVLQPPLSTSIVTISDVKDDGTPNNRFTVHGDQTARFPNGHLMRIETEQVYLIGASIYDPVGSKTTVVLHNTGAAEKPAQVFQDSFSDPKIYVSSGPTPITSAPSTPAYFAEVVDPDLRAFEAIARGSNTLLLPRDQTTAYRVGTVLLFTDTAGSFTDFLQVSGAAYDPATNRTTVMLSANAPRQYVYGAQLLLRSVRPVFEGPVAQGQTLRVPKLTQPHRVYRKSPGQTDDGLVSPTLYTIDDTGRIVFAEPLGPLEEFSIVYTGLSIPTAGLRLRASYTSQITPSTMNGLLGQTLLADYQIRSPDNFYFRVEPMTNFRGEYAVEIAAAASSGSSGPQTSNATQPKLWEQGRKSLYFDERHLANQDIIARTSLLFYNDLINLLERYRRELDGTVVGNNDGPLLFDGGTGQTHPPGAVSNQIDDTIKVSDAPYTTTYPPFRVTSIGTYRKYYLPGPFSRFYPTAKNFFGVTTDTTVAMAGTEVLDTKSTNVTQVSNLHFRQAWGIVTEDSQYSGTDGAGRNILKVDFASGNEPGFVEQSQRYARLPFIVGMKCRILHRNGFEISAFVAIEDVTDNQISVSGGVGAGVPVGSTIYQTQSDDSGSMFTHVAGRDYSFNGESGQVTYVAPAGDQNMPLFGSYPYTGLITLTNTLTEPCKFPALFGGVEDDDGELSFPVQTPDPNSEKAGYLATESKLIRAAGSLPAGLVRARFAAPRTSTGSVASPNLRTIVDATIGSMSPAPQPGDLVRIKTGTNAGVAFRRIASVASGSLTVETGAPGYAVSAGFSYELVVSVAGRLDEWDAALAGEESLYVTEQATLLAAIEQASAGVSYFGLSEEIPPALSSMYTSISALIAPLAPLRAKLAAATGLDVTDLDFREVQVNARLSKIAEAVAQIVDILANTERLYDKRYVWLDARINLENGILVRQEAATKNRLKAQADVIKQLMKLLAVRGT